MMNIPFFKKLTVVLAAVFFASCDKDYNTIGSDIVGNENFNFTHNTFEVKAYNQKVPVVQTNNLQLNQLGILNNDVFGKTRANFVTQLSLGTLKPTFTSGVVVDSVVLSVPYFSHKTKTESNGHGIYELDSIHSSTLADPIVYEPINLKVFRNGYYLNDYDTSGDLSTSQKFFSNQDALFSGQVASAVLNNASNVAENSSFVPSAKEIVIFKRDAAFAPTTDVESRIKPSMRLHLDKTHFEDEIIEKAIAPATADEFENNNIFKTKYKGLYFQVEDAPSGSLMSMDFSKGTVTIYYRQDKANTTPVTKEMKTLVLNMTGNTVNLLENTGGSTGYLNAVSDAATGADELYLKGGEGSMAFIDLFTNAAEFAPIKDQEVLINDASLTFTVKNLPGFNKKNLPQRVYIFDAENNMPLYDFYFDNSQSSNPKRNRYIHGGLKVVKDDGITTTYKVRITEHVARIIREKINALNPVSKLNIRLGLVVTESINTVLNSYFQDETIMVGGKKFDRLPVASVMNPLGVVLYGSNFLPTDADYDKRIKFEIYYTKPN